METVPAGDVAPHLSQNKWHQSLCAGVELILWIWGIETAVVEATLWCAGVHKLACSCLQTSCSTSNPSAGRKITPSLIHHCLYNCYRSTLGLITAWKQPCELTGFISAWQPALHRTLQAELRTVASRSRTAAKARDSRNQGLVTPARLWGCDEHRLCHTATGTYVCNTLQAAAG